MAAHRGAGRKPVNKLVPAAAGAGLVATACVLISMLMGGESARKAVDVAERELGPGYRFHVRSLNVRQGGGATSVRGVVRAWNATGIRDVPVAWEEQP